MGEHNIEQEADEQRRQEFTHALLNDLRALAFMLEEGRLESGVRRMGAEQEMFLVDHSLRPTPIALEVLDLAADARLTTEIARFNLEANLTPVALTGRCFKSLHEELKSVVAGAQAAAAKLEADGLLSGILPTLFPGLDSIREDVFAAGVELTRLLLKRIEGAEVETLQTLAEPQPHWRG